MVNRSRGTSYQTREPRCGCEGPKRMHCSLAPGHSGPHIALGMDKQVLATWGRLKKGAIQ